MSRYLRPGVNRKKGACACQCTPFPLAEEGTPADLAALTGSTRLILNSVHSSLEGAAVTVVQGWKDQVVQLGWHALGPIAAGGCLIETGSPIQVSHGYQVTLVFQLGGVISYCPQTFFATGQNP